MKRLIVLALLTVVTAFSASSQEMTSLLFRPPVQSPELSEEGLTLRYRASIPILRSTTALTPAASRTTA